MRFYLTEDGDVVDIVVVGQWLDEPVAEAALPAPHRTLLLLAARQPHHGHGEELARTATRGVRVPAPQGQPSCRRSHPAESRAPSAFVPASAWVMRNRRIHQ